MHHNGGGDIFTWRWTVPSALLLWQFEQAFVVHFSPLGNAVVTDVTALVPVVDVVRPVFTSAVGHFHNVHVTPTGFGGVIYRFHPSRGDRAFGMYAAARRTAASPLGSPTGVDGFNIRRFRNSNEPEPQTPAQAIRSYHVSFLSARWDQESWPTVPPSPLRGNYTAHVYIVTGTFRSVVQKMEQLYAIRAR